MSKTIINNCDLCGKEMTWKELGSIELSFPSCISCGMDSAGNEHLSMWQTKKDACKDCCKKIEAFILTLEAKQ